MSGKTYKKLQCVTLSSDFRAAVSMVQVPLVAPAAGEILVKNHYAGVNATDVNVTAGRYFTDGKVPFDVGFEGLGVIEDVGSDVSEFQKGQPVLTLGAAAYSEYIYCKPDQVFPVPDVNPEYLVTLVNAMTACIALDEVARIKTGDKVLITAAAGGTGQVAVQYAKIKGCTVIATTSSDIKADFLKSIGVDHVINYKTQDLDAVLKDKYPDGIDVIWETIGGKIFELLFNHLAVKGRLVIIGGITGYQATGSGGIPPVNIDNLSGRLLMSSASLNGFLLSNYANLIPTYWAKMMQDMKEGKIKVKVDQGEGTTGGAFTGIADSIRAVEHLHSGTNQGKVVVKIQ